MNTNEAQDIVKVLKEISQSLKEVNTHLVEIAQFIATMDTT